MPFQFLDSALLLNKRPFHHSQVTFGPQALSKRPFWRLQPVLEPEEDEDDGKKLLKNIAQLKCDIFI